MKAYLERLVEHDVRTSVMLWGPPGIGKSSVVRQTAQSHGLELTDLRLSQLAPTDIRGLPVPVEGITTWAPPEFLPRTGRGILFLDEINMAPPAMQGVAQQLILDRKVGSYRVPDGWFVWAAGNRKEDRAAVFDMPAPVANRFIHLEMSADLAAFKRHAFVSDFHEQVVAFLSFRSDLLFKFDRNEPAWPSPRSWEVASTLHRAGLDVVPAVGTAAGQEFAAYVDLLDKIPNLDTILAGNSSARFPDEVSIRYGTVVGLACRVDAPQTADHAFTWLVERADVEWVQMFAVDLFPKLRERGVFEESHRLLVANDKVREFLVEFARLTALG